MEPSKQEIYIPLKNEDGTVTIYLVIAFVTMIIFIGLFVDLARITIAQNQLRRVANSSARSVLADYDTKTKQEFGLFSYAKNGDECSKSFEKYLQVNLASSKGQSFNLMDYKYEKSQAKLLSPLAQQEVLKRQILEDMKYRAPVELGIFVADKVRSIGRIFNFFESKNLERKNLGLIREKQKEIKNISGAIEDKKKRLLDKKTDLTQKEQDLQDEDNPEDREELRKEIAVMKSEIKELKREVRIDLVKCKQLNNEINDERVNLIENGYTGSNDPDNLDRCIQETNQKMGEKLRTVKNSIDQTYIEVSRDIDKSIAALDAGDYGQIGVSVVNMYAAEPISNEQLTNEKTLTNQETQLKARVASSVYADCLGAFSSKEAARNEDSFEEKNGKDIDEVIKNTKKILSIEDILTNARDELYINEYILTHFSYLTEPSTQKNMLYEFYNSEAEYICFENLPKVRSVSEIYLIRFGLDTMAYLCFSKAPTDPLTRFIYSTIMGSIQAGVDTLKLVLGQSVAVAEMIDPTNPAGGNPLNDIRTNYREHLRLLLFIHEDGNKGDGDYKLERILKVISTRNNVAPATLNTVVRGQVEVSIRMWFLPLAELANTGRGPFGTKIKDGRCYITKAVEYGY